VYFNNPYFAHLKKFCNAMPIQIESKLPRLQLTIFSVMTQLANDHQAINLSQGFPDFDANPQLIEQVHHYIRANHNQYAPMQGVMALREAISAKVHSQYGAFYDPETEITVTSGATEALFAGISALIRPGDEVILFEPAYDSYLPVIQLNGGVPVFLKLKFPEYRIDWNEVADALNPKTRLIIINTPHNPTGAVLSATDIEALEQIVSPTGIFILSDEVYEHIIFDDRQHASMARYPALVSRSFVVSSFGKTYHTTGWKIGYCLAPAPLSQEFQKIHQYLTFASNTPIQLAYADMLQDETSYTGLSPFYQRKRDLFQSLMNPSRFKILPCAGTYFQMVDYSDISDQNDVAFARELTQVHGVAAIPPSVFYHQHDDHRVLRFCFAKKDQTLIEAAEKLCQI
jgi:methionine aminotransferase